jgi:hypothetical protein
MPEQTQPDDLLGYTQNTLHRMLDYRKQFDAKRVSFYRQYIGQRDAMKFPDNVTLRSNTFVPYPLSNVETVVSRTSDAFFSFMPWFECSGTTSQEDMMSDAMALLMGVKLRKCNIVNIMEQFIRNCAIYGHAGLKVDWDWNFDTVVKPAAVYAQDQNGQQILDPQTGQPIVQGYQTQSFQVPRARPKITPIDIYDLLVDPDGQIKGHLGEKSLIELQKEAFMYKQRTGGELYDPAVISDLVRTITASHKGNPGDVIIRYAELWDNYTNTCTIITAGEDYEALAWKDTRASYRATSYSPYKRPIYTGPAKILWHGPNPFAHQQNPILETSYIKLPNEVYGLGVIETTADLTESLNKMVNMITDNWNLGINRRYAYDENADIDHEALNRFNVPGGKVPVNGNPKDVIEPLPFFTPPQGDYAILDLYRGLQETASGISDFYSKGVGSPTGNGTATGISSIINESNYRFKLFIRNLEVDILQPMLNMCCINMQQFLTDDEEVAISGQPPGVPKWQVVQPAALIGNYEFSLVAANYATNKMLRQRNLMSFMQMAMQSPYWRQGEGLRELGKVLEIRDIDSMLKSDQEVQMEQQAEQQHEMQMMLLQKVVDVEGKVEVAEAKGKAAGHPGTGPPNKKPGRPNSPSRPEGKTPGTNAVGMLKSLGQLTGANAMGLEGMGEVPGS